MSVRLAVASLALALTAAPVAERPLHHVEATRLSMGCVYAIDAYGDDEETLRLIVEDGLDEVDRIDRLMSNYKADSALSHLNREAAHHPVFVDPELFDFIADAMHYSRESDGAFDITVGPLMRAWGFFRGEGRVPGDGELAAVRRHVGADHVILDPLAKTIAFDEPDVELDLNGIAKGYAVDRLVDLFKRQRVAAALVTSGGSTTYGLGAPPGKEAWEVALQDPKDARKIARTFQLKDRALSVAGGSEKFFESNGVRYAHIMDPRTGRPVQGILSVAVLAPTATAGDALDNAFFVLGPDKSREYVKRWPDVEPFFFLDR